ncbi:MAG: hypothetical protein HY064_07960 [Bacteroidetes bacterium]|nr:hypothetical protein [Bacteroidota bacterium]
MKFRGIIFFGFFAVLLFITACRVDFIHNRRRGHYQERKPVIYLYPEKTENISVKINSPFPLTFSEPFYNDGWKVSASADGKLTNNADAGREKNYPYLFYEASDDHDYSFEKGFVVSGDSSRIFLENILPQMGLLPVEYDEFISYWVPMMEKNKLNLITSPNEEHAQLVKLDIDPAPQTSIRVFMLFKSVPERISICPRNFTAVPRKGFTVVEWGGINEDEIIVP